ncbi:hypothetical protein K438DRAFT_287825 [Mycena galopus ATCC 62051]|nr:hypothetical protein K438DRAFT_287825 [Mycena galopus ATCC 62051]
MSHNRRTSLLGQAGEQLSLWSNKARRRPSLRQPQPAQPVLTFDHVIDITAAAPDEELEERQRLRDAAAQSIGLGPLLETPEADPDPPETTVPTTVVLPPFPASPGALAPFVVLSGSLPKYYPPSNLRIFALAKQWKSRYLLLSVPAGTVSHLHLFKGSNPDDRELERLEINADSVVFVAESPLGTTPDPHAPAHVVKVAGADVGALRKEWNASDDAGRTVWLLHLTPLDAQRWISAIKSAIFEQRTQRAGLAPSTSTGTAPIPNEPRGDMDVMLSMRMHASRASAVNLPSPVTVPQTTNPNPNPSLPNSNTNPPQTPTTARPTTAPLPPAPSAPSPPPPPRPSRPPPPPRRPTRSPSSPPSPPTPTRTQMGTRPRTPTPRAPPRPRYAPTHRERARASPRSRGCSGARARRAPRPSPPWVPRARARSCTCPRTTPPAHRASRAWGASSARPRRGRRCLSALAPLPLITRMGARGARA